MRYGRWTITEEWPPIPIGRIWSAVHDEYDGPEGMWPYLWDKDLDSLKADIDEWEAEHS